MPNHNSSIAELAQIAFDTYYHDSYKDFEEDLNETLRFHPEQNLKDELADMIASDIRDLLHNGNDLELWPFTDTELTEAESEALSRRFHDDYNNLLIISGLIATMMLKNQEN